MNEKQIISRLIDIIKGIHIGDTNMKLFNKMSAMEMPDVAKFISEEDLRTLVRVKGEIAMADMSLPRYQVPKEHILYKSLFEEAREKGELV